MGWQYPSALCSTVPVYGPRLPVHRAPRPLQRQPRKHECQPVPRGLTSRGQGLADQTPQSTQNLVTLGGLPFNTIAWQWRGGGVTLLMTAILQWHNVQLQAMQRPSVCPHDAPRSWCLSGLRFTARGGWGPGLCGGQGPAPPPRIRPPTLRPSVNTPLGQGVGGAL